MSSTSSQPIGGSFDCLPAIWRHRKNTSHNTPPSSFCFFFSHFYFPASGQAVVTDLVPSSPPVLAFNFIAHRVQQSHCSSICHRVFLSSCALHKSIYAQEKVSMHSAGLELTKLTYTRLEDNLIRHRGEATGYLL